MWIFLVLRDIVPFEAIYIYVHNSFQASILENLTLTNYGTHTQTLDDGYPLLG